MQANFMRRLINGEELILIGFLVRVKMEKMELYK